MEENRFNWFDKETADKITEDGKELMKDLKKTWNDFLELLKIE